MMQLSWLPEAVDWRERLKRFAAATPSWGDAVALAGLRLDFVRTNALDQAVLRLLGETPPTDIATRPVRLAVLGASTTAHLLGAIRVGCLRRGIHATVYEADYGQYWQALSDPASDLHAFRPDTILLALDAMHLALGVEVGMSEADAEVALSAVTDRLRACWALAREAGATVIQQVPLPLHTPLLGGNEHRLAGSKAAFLARLNAALRRLAAEAGVALVALDMRAALDGLRAWHSPDLWHRAKQEVSPAAAPMYGDMVGRLVAARQGRSAKCLVLDLDNTLWGGVIGDDGLEGIEIGQGSPLGEAFAAFQTYARDLSRRGIILAVCSKNDEANAWEPFDKHPDMVLRRADIACLVANWDDKASNLRAIAERLNIGLDSLVFVDDNPFERNLVRQHLPMVAVPEVGDDPASFAATLADAGYFEALTITDEDLTRSGQYQGNMARASLKESAVDLPSYLRGLDMRLVWRRFDAIGLQRIVQLINKTNQFNLTTRRYTEAEVLAVMADPSCFGLQLRLLDRFGDNGIVAIVIGRMDAAPDLHIDTWLMSCRVLGREVETTTLNLVAEQARRLGAARLIGDYRPTAKNAMVRDHYARLGFTTLGQTQDGGNRAALDLVSFEPAATFIQVQEG